MNTLTLPKVAWNAVGRQSKREQQTLHEFVETTLHWLGLLVEAEGEHWEAAFPERRLLLPQAGGHTVRVTSHSSVRSLIPA